MFETSLVESSGGLRSKSGRYLWVTATFNAAVVAVMVVVPLLYPEALPRTALMGTLTAPPVPAPATPPAVPLAKAAKAVAPLDVFTAPSRIPKSIARVSEEPPPASGPGVIGMTGTAPDIVGAVKDLGLGASVPVAKIEPAKVAGPLHVSSGVVAGNKLSGSDPVYPAIARAAHVSGTVVLHALISRSGSIEKLAVVSGPEMLRASAVAAVQGWTYRAYLLNGQPTEVETTITVNFTFGG